MLTERQQLCALIVSKSDRTPEAIGPILTMNGIGKILRAQSAGEARRTVMSRVVDIAIINTPLSDDFGIQLAIELSERNICVLTFVKGDRYEQIAYKLEEYGVITLAKPVDRASLVISVRMLKAMRAKLVKMETQRSSLESKMREIRLVNRAKLLLVERLSMTEEEAHRFTEKQAMDSCVKKGEIAENIIKTYEI